MRVMEKRQIKKVIFIGYAPLTISTEKNFYFNEILSQGLELQYWDLTEIFFPLSSLPDSINKDYIKFFPNMNELEKKLKLEKIEEILVIPIIGFEWRSLYLYYILNKYKCRLGFFARGMLPIYSINLKRKILSKLHSLLCPKEVWRLFLNQVAYFIRKRSSIGHYNVVFAAGKVAEKSFVSITNCIVCCNHFDYDDALEFEQKSSYNKINYIVFLDEFLSGHPDFKMQNTHTVSENNYFCEMNLFFQKLEKTLGLEVIIASHPKANYDLKVFDGRKIIKYQTAELAKNATLIIAHVSTSIGFGVIYQKPIVLTYTQDLKAVNPTYVGYINTFGRALNCLVIEIDEFIDTDQIFHLKDIDTSSYNAYLENYLTSNESKRIHTKQIFLNYLARFEG